MPDGLKIIVPPETVYDWIRYGNPEWFSGVFELGIDDKSDLKELIERGELLEPTGARKTLVLPARGKVAGWWAIDPKTGKEVPPPVDKGKLQNAIPGTDPDKGATYIGDGPLDARINFIDQVVAMYQESWDRDPTKAEWKALLKQPEDYELEHEQGIPKGKKKKKAAQVGTDTAEIYAIAPEQLLHIIEDGEWKEWADEVFGNRAKGGDIDKALAEMERIIQQHGGAYFHTGSDGSWDVSMTMGGMEPPKEEGYQPPYGTSEEYEPGPGPTTALIERVARRYDLR